MWIQYITNWIQNVTNYSFLLLDHIWAHITMNYHDLKWLNHTKSICLVAFGHTTIHNFWWTKSNFLSINWNKEWIRETVYHSIYTNSNELSQNLFSVLGMHWISYSVHRLAHIITCIKQSGPMSTLWLFGLEGMNNFLEDFIFSTHGLI